jgi:hypothetical protein
MIGELPFILGMPTLYRAKTGENFLKGVPMDNFRILFIADLVRLPDNSFARLVHLPNNLFARQVKLPDRYVCPTSKFIKILKAFLALCIFVFRHQVAINN